MASLLSYIIAAALVTPRVPHHPKHVKTVDTSSQAARDVPRLFIFGLGYVGLHVAQQALALGWQVSGSCRTACQVEGLRSTGIDAYHFDLDESYAGLEVGGLEALSQATHVLATVPPVADMNRDPMLALHSPQLLAAASEAGSLRWTGYLSTTSVYGDHSGEWVDEGSECRAASGSSADDRLRAEGEWLALQDATGGRLSPRIFRLAGIYGPGRSALDTVARARGSTVSAIVTALADAEPGVDGEQSRSFDSFLAAAAEAATKAADKAAKNIRATPNFTHVSRVHVDDISAALIESMSIMDNVAERSQFSTRSSSSRIINLADDAPAPRGEVMAYAAALLDVTQDVARVASAVGEGGHRATRRAKEHKRVRNGKMRELLKRSGLIHSSYREGLLAVLVESRS